MEWIIQKTVCGFFWLLRKLFMSSKIGVIIHNFILLLIDKILSDRFGREIPDIPEIRKLLRNGRWKSPTTSGFTRKTYTLHPHVRKRIIENLIWRSVSGYTRHRRLLKRGYLIPSNIFLSPTYNCNLNCQGCYADGHEGERELSLSEIERIADEQEQLGIFHILIFGGEPFLREDLWQVYDAYPRTIFDVFTNGTLLSEREVERITKLGNVRILISLEGFKETTDNRRGEGVYDAIITALKLCQKEKIYFGVSVTIGKENFEEVTSKAFLDEMNKFGILVISYVLYMSYGQKDGAFSELTSDEVLKLEERGKYIQDHYPIFPLIGRNGSDLVTSCPAAAAAGRIHIAANGDVEPCVFCQFAADNIRGKSIAGVMNSEFFQRIRLFKDIGTSLLNPCQARKSVFLQNDFLEVGAHSTTGGKSNVKKESGI